MTSTNVLHLNTPLVESLAMTNSIGRPVLLKLENTQPAHSFKIRGIGNLVQKAKANGYTHLVCSSGGNAGLAATYAGVKMGMHVTVLVPSTTPKYMLKKLELAGAETQVHGDVWNETDVLARKLAEKDKHLYVPPFDHPDIWAGHASMIEEIQEALKITYKGVYDPKPAAVVVSVGGGGLLLGALIGMENCGWGDVPLFGVETEGAESFRAAYKKKEIVTLDSITSIAKSLGSTKVSSSLLEWIENRKNFHSVVVKDKDAVDACLKFAGDHKILVEPACGASLSIGYNSLSTNTDNVQLDCLTTNESGVPAPIIIVVCGGNMTSIEYLTNLQKTF